MAKYDWKDLEALRDDWWRVFGESMAMGFVITPEQVPMMKECIEKESQKPLQDYIDSFLKITPTDQGAAISAIIFIASSYTYPWNSFRIFEANCGH